ncbi:hypothetical protein, partial [Rhodococcus rhodochrous]|uniref:hypothetical protein n=1 Tax=Rhodococcus rhodochrous TaxID=1829 RepID=UPI001E2E76DB
LLVEDVCFSHAIGHLRHDHHRYICLRGVAEVEGIDITYALRHAPAASCDGKNNRRYRKGA